MPRTKSPDYARLDDIDVYIQSIPRSPEEEKRLHDLLRKEMEKSRARPTTSNHSTLTPRKRANAKATIARTKTPDYDRLDDVDIYVQSTPMTPEEEKRLSAIIKANREKYDRSKSRTSNVKTPKRSKAASR
jgi:hypothetical protein